MVRKYVRKTEKPDTDTINRALEAVSLGMSLRAAAREFNVGIMTLQRHNSARKKLMEVDDVPQQTTIVSTQSTPTTTVTASAEPTPSTSTVADAVASTSSVVQPTPSTSSAYEQRTFSAIEMKSRGGQTIFSPEVEAAMEDYMLHASDIYFGITSIQAREMAFQIADRLRVRYPSSWASNGIAGVDWFRGFLRRHPKLSMRTPEATSLARASAFNKANVEAFFNLYEQVAQKVDFAPYNIWNIDETAAKKLAGQMKKDDKKKKTKKVTKSSEAAPKRTSQRQNAIAAIDYADVESDSD